MAEAKGELLIDHHQKTYELTYRLWTQRNRIFLLHLATISVATLLTCRVSGAESLFVAWVAGLLGTDGESQVRELRASFPFALLQSILMMVVFYLMLALYHRALHVLCNYAYLGALETEIRELLDLQESHVAFTRESVFCWSNRPRMLGAVKWVYIALLGLLLFAFLGGRLVGDFRAGDKLPALVDGLVVLPTTIFFFAYATTFVNRDSAQPRSNDREEAA